jgi:hypothetical protein
MQTRQSIAGQTNGEDYSSNDVFAVAFWLPFLPLSGGLRSDKKVRKAGVSKHRLTILPV